MQSITFHCLPVLGFVAWYRTLLMNVLREHLRQIGLSAERNSVRIAPSVMPVVLSVFIFR
jgi:hypothetical protein